MRKSVIAIDAIDDEHAKRRGRRAMTIDEVPHGIRDAVAAARWGEVARAPDSEDMDRPA